MADAVLIMQALANPDKYGIKGSESSHITAQGTINADVSRHLLTCEHDVAVINFARCNTKITLLPIKIWEKASIFIKKQMLVCQMHHLAKPVFIRL